MTHQPPHDELQRSSRTAGVALLVGSILTVVFMAHHPTFSGRGPAEFVEAVARLAWINSIVHGSLIAVLMVLIFGFWGLAARLGTHLATVRLGWLAYVLGAAAMIAAALIDGFVVAEYVLRYRNGSAEELALMRHVLRLAFAANQCCARLGVVAMSSAFVLWSIALLTRPGWLRGLGVLGCLVGAGPVVALLLGLLPMNVHGVGAFVLAQSVWSIAVAVQLLRGRM